MLKKMLKPFKKRAREEAEQEEVRMGLSPTSEHGSRTSDEREKVLRVPQTVLYELIDFSKNQYLSMLRPNLDPVQGFLRAKSSLHMISVSLEDILKSKIAKTTVPSRTRETDHPSTSRQLPMIHDARQLGASPPLVAPIQEKWGAKLVTTDEGDADSEKLSQTDEIVRGKKHITVFLRIQGELVKHDNGNTYLIAKKSSKIAHRVRDREKLKRGNPKERWPSTKKVLLDHSNRPAKQVKYPPLKKQMKPLDLIRPSIEYTALASATGDKATTILTSQKLAAAKDIRLKPSTTSSRALSADINHRPASSTSAEFVVPSTTGIMNPLTWRPMASRHAHIDRRSSQQEGLTTRDETPITSCWSKHEDELLKHAVTAEYQKHPASQTAATNWELVATFYFRNFRTSLQCRERWRRLHRGLRSTQKQDPPPVSQTVPIVVDLTYDTE
jgi:hypothetical protein